MVNEIPSVLQLDVAGNPVKWINVERFAYYQSKGLIAWTMGEVDVTLRGGINAKSGKQSTMQMNTIIALKGKSKVKDVDTMNRVALSNDTLFKRDLNICAYCGGHFNKGKLTREHIHPTSRGGKNIWTNVVTACQSCNLKKDARTPEEAKMPLLYVPYEPSRSEYLILKNHQILADQMQFLMTKVPKNSRLFL